MFQSTKLNFNHLTSWKSLILHLTKRYSLFSLYFNCINLRRFSMQQKADLVNLKEYIWKQRHLIRSLWHSVTSISMQVQSNCAMVILKIVKSATYKSWHESSLVWNSEEFLLESNFESIFSIFNPWTSSFLLIPVS